MAAGSDQYNGDHASAAGHEPVEYPARVRRILAGHPPRSGPGPRTAPSWMRRQRKDAARVGTALADRAPATAPAAGALTEWHEMTPGQQFTAWADLRAWVEWLTDRYELTVEERMPRCWASHPGLVEELWALRTWRREIYGSGLNPAGQAARYWHAELERVVHAAASRYAAGCRAGHRGAQHPVAEDKELPESWAKASLVAGVPPRDLDAVAARSSGDWVSAEEMAAAIDTGEAVALPGLGDHVIYRDGWWLPAPGGWYQDPSRPETPADNGIWPGEVPDGGSRP